MLGQILLKEAENQLWKMSTGPTKNLGFFGQQVAQHFKRATESLGLDKNLRNCTSSNTTYIDIPFILFSR